MLRYPQKVLSTQLSLSIKEAVEMRNASWMKVFDKEPLGKAGIHQWMEADSPFRNSIPQEFPEMGVIRIESGQLSGKQGWVSTPEGEWISELSWYGATGESPAVVSNKYNVHKIKGKSLSLLSDWSDTNYNHFLLDSLGRLALIHKAGIRFDIFDHIFCHIPGDYARKLLNLLNVPIERCISPHSGCSYICDQLYVPSYPGVKRFYPQWLAHYLRDAISEASGDSFRRLYIPRLNNRRILNDNELISILEKYDFEIFDPSDSLFAHKTFSEAIAVIAPHGAALANLVFCRPGTKVLELLPSDHIFPHYFSLSAAANLEYSFIVGKSVEERPFPKFGPSPYDFYVDAVDFERKLQQTLTSF